jgi:hypothetical protein
MTAQPIRLDSEMCQGCKYGCTECQARIPAPMACGDCRSFRRCTAFLSRKGHERSCDWIPSYFAAKETP